MFFVCSSIGEGTFVGVHRLSTEKATGLFEVTWLNW
jgi:hypothetical protein